MSETGRSLPTIILAGERPGGSPLAHVFSVAASVMVPVAGQPALQRVVTAIKASQLATTGIICGPTAGIVADNQPLSTLLDQSGFRWMAQASGPAASAAAAVQTFDHYPVLLTAGDHALLTPEIVDDFCRDALQQHNQSVADFIIGLVPYPLVQAAWPESKRTVLKFSGQHYCGCNLFAVLSRRGLQALKFWQQVEADRKQPWRMARHFGTTTLLRYLARQLSLPDALRTLSKAAGCKIDFVTVNHARAAVDVDSVDDQALAEKILLAEQTQADD